MGSVLSACGPHKSAPSSVSGSNTNPTNTATIKRPAVGGELNLILEEDPDNFNPIYSSSAYGGQIYSLVFATLFEFDATFTPTPMVAESWKATDDGLHYTIKIRQGIKFHDGGDLTADDVAFTLNTLMDPDYTGPRSASVVSVDKIYAPDLYTLQIDLKEPFAPIFTNINFGILQKKNFEGTPVKGFERHPITTTHPIGAGPYKFVEYKRGQYVLLERNESWFMSAQRDGAPFITTLRFMIIPDPATAQAALENGEIDFLTPNAKEVARLRSDFAAKLQAIDYERNGWGYLLLNTQSEHLQDKLVRQALTYALDRPAIITGVLDNLGVIPAGPISSVSWAFDPALKPLPFDPAKAKALLEEAGYSMGPNGILEKEGKPFKLRYYSSASSTTSEGVAAIARKNWKDIGIDVEVQFMDYTAMNEQFLKPGRFDVSFAGIALGIDPDQYNQFHSSAVSGFNRGRYSNPRVDQLLEEGRREPNLEKRKAIYAEYQQILVDDAPVILLYANKYTDFVSTKVKGGIVTFPGVGATQPYRWYINEQ